MAASTGVTAFSTVLIWNYREVLEVSNITGPAGSMSPIDVTSHDSENGFKEYIAGLHDGGEISLEGNFLVGDTAGQVAFHTDTQGGTNRSGYIVAPMAAASALSFSALGKGFDNSFPTDAQIGVSGSLVVTGKPTLLTSQSAGMSGLTGDEYDDTVKGSALSISPTIAVGSYAYTCEVTDSDQDGVKLTITAASHTIYANGDSYTSTQEGSTIALGDAGTDTVVIIVAYESSMAPRIYRLTITRPSA